jgi:cardiolipin synthase
MTVSYESIILSSLALAIHFLVLTRALAFEGRDAQARASWLLLLFALPGLGTLLYVLFGEPWTSRRFRRKSDEARVELARLAPSKAVAAASSGSPDNALTTCEKISGWSRSTGNSAEALADADDAIDMLVADIEAAERTVHLSFYIWLADGNGTRVAEAVARAARRGVRCRVAADAIGSRDLIRSQLWKAMASAGAAVCASMRIPFDLPPLAGRRLDLRNHRKIAVVDGRIGYCGSQNCADAAFLIKRRFAPWFDVFVRLQGPIARQLELVFAELWMVDTGEDLLHLFAEPPAPGSGDCIAVVIGSGPLSPAGSMTDVFTACIAAASRTLTITTPYFVPNAPVLQSLIAAGRRGVAVRMVLPRRNDSRIVGAISRAHYPALSSAGVRIFEFEPGLLHAKTLLVDRSWGLIGSANMDRRSLELNYENNLLFSEGQLAEQIHSHQTRWLSQAEEVTSEATRAPSSARRILDNALTMFGAVF